VTFKETVFNACLKKHKSARAFSNDKFYIKFAINILITTSASESYNRLRANNDKRDDSLASLPTEKNQMFLCFFYLSNVRVLHLIDTDFFLLTRFSK